MMLTYQFPNPIGHIDVQIWSKMVVLWVVFGTWKAMLGSGSYDPVSYQSIMFPRQHLPPHPHKPTTGIPLCIPPYMDTGLHRALPQVPVKGLCSFER